MIDAVPRARLATLPTPLERGPLLPGGARLWVKRDDLTGLGMGGNKARKLELLCGAAQAEGADVLVTVGAEQSNHARMTAAAGAVLGLETHLVLGAGHGGAGGAPAGNRLLDELFGARVHQIGSDDWDVLGQALSTLIERLLGDGRRPYAMPMGGSTIRGALGFAAAWTELRGQLDDLGVEAQAIVHASSTGGTHGGLLAGAASDPRPGPRIVAVEVAKQPGTDLAAIAHELAVGALEHVGAPGADRVDGLIELDRRWLGEAYAIPTDAGDDAIRWAARHGGWVLDRVYTGKAFAGLLGLCADGRFGPGDDVVFWHTGGHPALFAPGGAPGF